MPSPMPISRLLEQRSGIPTFPALSKLIFSASFPTNKAVRRSLKNVSMRGKHCSPLKMEAQPFVLTTLPELGNEPVIISRNHIFYEAKKSDVFLNTSTVNANLHRLADVTLALGWGEHTVWQVLL